MADGAYIYFPWAILALGVICAGFAAFNKRGGLVVGILVSAFLHFAAFEAGIIFKPKPPPPPKDQAPTVQLIAMPKLEPPPPDVVDDTQVVTHVNFAPPMQTDVPQVATPMSFVQQVEPPPPEAMINKNALTVPQNTGNWRNGMQVFDISMLDQIPIATFRPPPNYPFEMRRAGITGSVVVDFIVDTEGNVINAYAISSTQHDFEAAAVQGVSRWKFKPGRRGGRVVATHMQVPIQFSLNTDQ